MAEGMDFLKSSLDTYTYAHDLKGQLKIGAYPSSMGSCDLRVRNMGSTWFS